MNEKKAKYLLFTVPAINAFNYLQNRNFNPHYSGNLFSTTELIGGANSITFDIPAPIYDMELYDLYGVFAYTGGSYAKIVNETGGFTGKHKNYIGDTINVLIEEIVNNAISNGLKVKKIEIK